MAPLEPWEKVLIDPQYPLSIHGHISCQECHGGVQDADKEVAHTGLIERPSEDVEGNCAKCHPNIVESEQHSLHNSLAGYWTVLEARGASRNDPAMQQAFNNHCASCHTSCGDCHVSQPASVGGGFINGHIFNEKPSLTRNCTACHGSRVGKEYLGKTEGLMADVHFRQGRMTCTSCHSAEDMHGVGNAYCQQCHTGPETEITQEIPAKHRYDRMQLPSCESCHTSVASGQDDNLMHTAHGGKLSCQVCHSIEYNNCDGCHVAISEKTGKPYFKTEASYMGFLIGRNPIRSFSRPYEYVPVRHVPISPTSFSYYGENLLPNFNNLNTWKYATPHNIQRNTPQTESCNACHENPALFLTLDKLKPEEINANLNVIVFEVPGSAFELMKPPTIPTSTPAPEGTTAP